MPGQGVCAQGVAVLGGVVSAKKKVASGKSHPDVGLRTAAVATVIRFKSAGAGSWSHLSHRSPFVRADPYSTTGSPVKAEDDNVFRHKLILDQVFTDARLGVPLASGRDRMLERGDHQLG